MRAIALDLTSLGNITNQRGLVAGGMRDEANPMVDRT